MKKTLLAVAIAAMAFGSNLFARQSDRQPEQEITPEREITKVYVVFKTHLDIGFTQLSSAVEKRYVDEFIPKAIEVAGQLRDENSEARYVWTTGSWLVSEYLKNASPDAVARLEKAIERGDIVWNGIPYTVESEIMDCELFSSLLKLSQQLDARFGKQTSAVKMTDVPGHTRGIVSLLSDGGIGFLHIGVNPASALPDVPDLCRWRNTDGKEVILMYQKDYGGDIILPDGRTAFSLKFTGDNHGPHSAGQVKEIFASLKKKYPNAQIVASSLDDVYEAVRDHAAGLPVITSEIGDTWIRGFASSPLRIARFKALSRLHADWIAAGKIDTAAAWATDFAVRLGLVAEHTWGVDVKTHLQNWDKYDVDIFNRSRSLPEFQMAEQSWAEQDAYIDQAIAMLPRKLQSEARKTVGDIDAVKCRQVKGNDLIPEINANGAYAFSTSGAEMLVGELAYQTFSQDDYNKFFGSYLRSHVDWAISDFGKPGLDQTNAKSATIVARAVNCNVTKSARSTIVRCGLEFPESDDIDPRVLPGAMTVEYSIPAKGDRIDVTLTIENKPANRLPEAYYLSFLPSDIERVIVEKLGFGVDVTDVVAGGNRQMHASDNYVDLVTDRGVFRVTSLDAPIVCVGERNALDYSKNLPDIDKGIHFCLFNNLWGTNFSMWFGGSIRYRFEITYTNN